jgi:hypothetical protein
MYLDLSEELLVAVAGTAKALGVSSQQFLVSDEVEL